LEDWRWLVVLLMLAVFLPADWSRTWEDHRPREGMTGGRAGKAIPVPGNGLVKFQDPRDLAAASMAAFSGSGRE